MRFFALFIVALISFVTIGCCPPGGNNTKLTVKIKSSSWETDRGTDYTNITDEHDRKLRFRGTHDLQPGKVYDIELTDCKKVRNITEAETAKPKAQLIQIEPSDKSGPRTFRVTVGADGKVSSEELPNEPTRPLIGGLSK